MSNRFHIIDVERHKKQPGTHNRRNDRRNKTRSGLSRDIGSVVDAIELMRQRAHATGAQRGAAALTMIVTRLKALSIADEPSLAEIINDAENSATELKRATLDAG